jgi:hypothetical protein
MASAFWYCDSRKAARELSFSPRDPMATLLDTVKDIRGEGRREKLVSAATPQAATQSSAPPPGGVSA